MGRKPMTTISTNHGVFFKNSAGLWVLKCKACGQQMFKRRWDVLTCSKACRQARARFWRKEKAGRYN